MQAKSSFVAFLFLLHATALLQAQEIIGLQSHDTTLAWHPVINFDSVSVWPGHIVVSDKQTHSLPDSLYTTDPVHARLFWKDTTGHPDTLRIRYYRYPASWYGTDRLLFIKSVAPTPFDNRDENTKSLLGGLQSSGVWEQGLLAGNRQNPVPQSRLDLRLSGTVTDNIRLQAHIRDDNLPMGYESVTTTFKDLNRIYVRIQGPGWNAAGGDSLWQYRSPLLAFTRDNKGLGIGYKTGNWQGDFSVAQQKGRYARNEFILHTGDYGPFALQTDAGEHEIYILHGSERVYLNGRRLNEGKDRDYQIDYGRARLLLNPGLDINTGDRLTVEFQYAARQFVRWSSFDRMQWSQGNNRWEWFWYNETDNPHRTLLTSLDSSTVAFLRQNPGDEMLWVPGWHEAGTGDEGILYERQNAGNTSYFVYVSTPNSSTTYYAVRFSYVGNGKGDYRLDRYLARGPVFVYVGTGRGDYVPYIRIRPPSDRRYTGIRWRRQWKNGDAELQTVYHYLNPNMFFAGRQNRINKFATAGKIAFKPQGKKYAAKLSWQNMPAGYRSPDPVQAAGFLHQWDLTRLPVENYSLIEATESRHDSIFDIQARQARLRIADTLRLLQGGLSERLNKSGWQHLMDLRLVSGRASDVHRNFYRFQTELNRNTGAWRPFVRWQREQRNRSRNGTADTLNYRLNQWETGLRWIHGRHLFRLSYRNNRSDSINNGRWNTTLAENILKARWRFLTRRNRFDVQIRRLDGLRSTGNPDWDFTTRWTGTDSLQAFHWDIQALHAASRIIRNEVIYRQVPQGQGQYVWNDYNGDGIAQDGEFEPAYYSDRADYIMVILPSVKYLPATRQQWNVHARFDPARRWTKLPAFMHWTFRLDVESARSGLREHTGGLWVTGLSADERNDLLQWEQSWQPFDALRLRYRLNLRALTDFTYNGKNYQFNRLQSWTARYRTKNGPWLEMFFNNRYVSTRSEFYALKNLAVQSYDGGLAAGGSNKRQHWESRLMHTRRFSSGRPMTAWDVLVRYDWHATPKPGNFGLSVRYAAVRFDGNPLSPVGYRILEGLRPGNNWIFDLHWSRRLYQNIRLQLFYQMRKTGTEPVIHTGHLALQAIF